MLPLGVPVSDPTAQPKPSTDAEAAFNDYVGLGDGRSLRKLHARYQDDPNPTPTKRLKTLKEWSARYGWQDRIRQAETEAAEEKLRLAAMLDADTFLHSSRLLNERMRYATREHADAIVKMRESVRKPAPKGTSVSVNVSIEMQRAVDRIAEEDGLTEDEKRELLNRLSRRIAERQ